MILEAFSKYLQNEENLNRAPERVLFKWLFHLLSLPAEPGDHISQVIHTEIEMVYHDDSETEGYITFEGKSETGVQLLKTLLGYCRSYEHWQFSKWLHHVQASDFNTTAL